MAVSILYQQKLVGAAAPSGAVMNLQANSATACFLVPMEHGLSWNALPVT